MIEHISFFMAKVRACLRGVFALFSVIPRPPLRLLDVWCLATILLSVSWAGLPVRHVAAQEGLGRIQWSAPVNLSNTPDHTSTDPFLVADPAGMVHLFWAEKISDAPGNSPDTILYSRWDGETWSQPVDLFFAPLSDGTPVVGYPHAVIDESGIMHLIWVSQPNFPHYSLNYSSVPVNRAGFVQAWQPPTVLAENLTGSKYSIHIAITDSSDLHVAYATGATGDIQTEDLSLSYIRSTDSGANWSEPNTLFTAPIIGWGVSDVRIVAQSPERLYMSWTLWTEDGTGHAIYFSRTNDGGLTWDIPIMLAEKLNPDEYERDWNAIAVIEPDKLVTMYEGGFRAYRFARYSYDGGETWTDKIDLFPLLIGENGFVEFARDSLNRLHMFIAQRHREGTDPGLRTIDEGTEETLWHSVWLGDEKWSEPENPGGYYGMINPKVVIVGGNKVVATFYITPIYEVNVMTGVIVDAPGTPAQVWAETDLSERGSVNPLSTQEQSAMPTPTKTPVPIYASSPGEGMNGLGQVDNPVFPIMIAVIPALVMWPLYLLIRKRRSNRG